MHIIRYILIYEELCRHQSHAIQAQHDYATRTNSKELCQYGHSLRGALTNQIPRRGNHRRGGGGRRRGPTPGEGAPPSRPRRPSGVVTNKTRSGWRHISTKHNRLTRRHRPPRHQRRRAADNRTIVALKPRPAAPQTPRSHRRQNAKNS